MNIKTLDNINDQNTPPTRDPIKALAWQLSALVFALFWAGVFSMF